VIRRNEFRALRGSVKVGRTVLPADITINIVHSAARINQRSEAQCEPCSWVNPMGGQLAEGIRATFPWALSFVY